MRRSLSISCERVPQPANDPLEQRTWAAVRIYVAHLCVTRWLESESQDELDTIYVPAFPLARWIVTNWWALFYEPGLDESPPAPFGILTDRQRAWLTRHCLRSAEAGLFLPRLSLWNDGQRICAQWSPDREGVYPSMPGYFLYGSSVALNSQEVEDALREFVNTVLRWIEDEDDPRAKQLRANWDAIIDASAEEAAFCRAAGQMGLDPYMLSSWPKELPDLLETCLSDEDPLPIVGDLLSATDPCNTKESWKWIGTLRKSLDIQQTPKQPPSVLDWRDHAGQAGFAAAYRLRQKLGLNSSNRLDTVADVANKMGLGTMTFKNHNHLPSTSIHAMVGWRAGRGPIVAGPVPQESNDLRFLEARGLFHAAFMCERGPRLITRAHDWYQQASRGFAAELLAPRAALLAEISPDLDEDERVNGINRLGQKYKVSTELVRRQYQNALRHGDAAD